MKEKARGDSSKLTSVDTFLLGGLRFPFVFSLSVFIRLNPWFQISKKIAASVPSQGVVLGWRRSAALHGGATGGDERRHIASALHRGSEGAQAISLNPLQNRLLPKSAFDRALP